MLEGLGGTLNIDGTSRAHGEKGQRNALKEWRLRPADLEKAEATFEILVVHDPMPDLRKCNLGVVLFKHLLGHVCNHIP